MMEKAQHFFNVAKEEVSRVVDLGDYCRDPSEELKRALSGDTVNKKMIMRAVLGYAAKALPEDYLQKTAETAMGSFPLKIEPQEAGGYRILQKLGSGYESTVYYIESGNKSFAVGLMR